MVSEEEEPQLNRDGPGLYNSTMSSMNDHILLVKRTTLQVVAESSDNNASNNKPLAYMTEIQQTKTFDSTSSAEDLSHGISRRRRRRRKSPHLDIDWKLLSCWEDFISTVYHIGCFAILGTSLRCFIGRFFGSDCTNVEFDNNPVGDFVQPFASKICITSDGRMKAGGSVFTDLPANMLGSLLMGVLSPNQSSVVFPWFGADHRLQRNVPLQLGLKVGLCGCLTTWSSWNTQMIVMMDGTATALPPQIGQALTGYIIGITCCVSSFIFGQTLRKCFRHQTVNQTHPGRPRSTVASSASSSNAGTHELTLRSIDIIEDRTVETSSEEKGGISWCTVSRLVPLTLILLLLLGYGLGDGLWGIALYRTMWMSTIVAPFGAVIRWRLSALNPVSSPNWFPTGTLVANTIAVVVGVAAETLESVISSNSSERLLWVSPILLAIEIGFAGSLSTVSTMVRELAFMKSPGRAIAYFSATAMISMSIGLAIYSPLIRAGQI